MNITKYFGSDVFDSYTRKYSWQSNQVAHAMMGFAGTTIVAHAAVELGQSHWWALVFLIIPILKDAIDYFADVYSTGNVFPLHTHHKKELKIDGITDFFFWSAGTALAVFFYFAALSPTMTLPLAFCLGVVAFYILAGIKFLYTPQIKLKEKFDSSQIPRYYRLSRFGTIRIPKKGIKLLDGEIFAPNGGSHTIEDFMAVDGPAHLLIVGPPASGKTTLAFGIGSGATVRNQDARYWTSEKFREYLLDTAETETAELKNGPMVICDDMLMPYEDPDVKDAVQAFLHNKRVIWVLARNDQNLQIWIKWLHTVFGIENPYVVKLHKLPETMKNLRIPFWTMLLAVLFWLILAALGSTVLGVVLL